MRTIPVYHQFNELHEVTGSSLRTSNVGFHCFKMSSVDEDMRSLPAYRSDFFTLALSFGSENFSIDINDQHFDDLESALICVAPGQVTSFRKEGNWSGFCTFFKAEFMQFKSELNFLEAFPFFNIQEVNLFRINDTAFQHLSSFYQQILHEQEEAGHYHTEVIRACFQAILWRVRRIYEANSIKQASDKASLIITSKFHYLVNKFFATKFMVEDYAAMLHITPNHLSQTIKAASGRTAKSYISQRRVEEAKYLLKYTDEDVSSISYRLHFSEPTHFNKFFKKETGHTPLDFRKQHSKHGN